MPFLIMILGFAATAMIWIYRARAAAEATHEVKNAFLSTRASYRKWKRGKAAQDAPFQAVEDPAEAAATLMMIIARMDGDLTAAQTGAIRSAMQETMKTGHKTEEIYQVARWLASIAPSCTKVARIFAPLFNRTLNSAEKTQLLDMLEHIARIEGELNEMQSEALAILAATLQRPASA